MRADERTQLVAPIIASTPLMQMSVRRGAACYAPLGDLFCSVSLALEKPVVNLVLAVYLPRSLPMPMAVKNGERVVDLALIESRSNLVGLFDVHNLVVLTVENPYGYSRQFTRAIRYELNV